METVDRNTTTFDCGCCQEAMRLESGVWTPLAFWCRDTCGEHEETDRFWRDLDNYHWGPAKEDEHMRWDEASA